MKAASFTPRDAVEKFRALHESGCFVLPNPWDKGTAIYLHRLGFKALATTSAGFAFARGKTDGKVPRDEMLAHIREIAKVTPLPVNADFLNGYADEPESVAENVKLCIDTGVAGLSIEDNTGRTDAPLYEKNLAIERTRAARFRDRRIWSARRAHRPMRSLAGRRCRSIAHCIGPACCVCRGRR